MKLNRFVKTLLFVILPVLGGLAGTSCSESDDTWDPYYDWQARNTAWYAQVTDSARTAIADAQATYGDDWENHCDWRRFKSLLKAQDYNTGKYTDSICVRIVKRGTGEVSPVWTDTVRLNFRGWLMPTTYQLYNDQRVLVDSLTHEVFSQTYYGVFNENTAAPQKMALGGTVEGFSTALQNMVAGDDWYVYIPQELAYGSNSSDAIPAYSTLLFRINLVGVYPVNSSVPTWK